MPFYVCYIVACQTFFLGEGSFLKILFKNGVFVVWLVFIVVLSFTWEFFKRTEIQAHCQFIYWKDMLAVNWASLGMAAPTGKGFVAIWAPEGTDKVRVGGTHTRGVFRSKVTPTSLFPAGKQAWGRRAVPRAGDTAPGALHRTVFCGHGRRLHVETPQLPDSAEDKRLLP